MTDVGANGTGDAVRHHVIAARVENKAGVLSRIAGLFTRRGFNIVSLTVSPIEDESLSRMTVVVDAESVPLEQVKKQLSKLIPVITSRELDPRRALERELMLATVDVPPDRRPALDELVGRFDAKIAQVDDEMATVVVTGTPDELDEITEALRGFGIVEFQRSGRVALYDLDEQRAERQRERARTA